MEHQRVLCYRPQFIFGQDVPVLNEELSRSAHSLDDDHSPII
jgi:hypothetical protein